MLTLRRQINAERMLLVAGRACKLHNIRNDTDNINVQQVLYFCVI